MGSRKMHLVRHFDVFINRNEEKRQIVLKTSTVNVI